MISLRKLRRGAIAVLITLLVAAVAAFAWVQTPPGKRQLARAIERAVGDDAVTLTIGNIGGFLPFEVRLSALSVADGDGIWLRADNAVLDWSPLALLSGRLEVEAVRFDRVAVDRLPAGAGEAQSNGSFSMPLAVRIARFEAAEFLLAEPVLGASARLSIAGTADLGDPISGFRLAAEIRRIDATPGALAIDLGYDPDSGRLTAEISAAEPTGGVIARLLDLPGFPPVSLGLSGDGSLEAWQASLTFEAGADLAAEAELGVAAVDGGYRLTIGAGATLAGLIDGAGRSLLAGRSALSGSAMISPDGAVEFDGVTLIAVAGEVTLEGGADWRRGTLDATAAIVAGRPEAFAELLPGIGWDRARADIRILGPLAGPRIEVAAVADGATTDGLAMTKLAAQLVLDPVQPPGLGGQNKVPFEGQGTLESLSVGDDALDALLAPAVTWQVSGELGLGGSSTIDRLDVEGAGAAITASGSIDADGVVDGVGTVTVTELAVYGPLAGLPIGGRADLSWRARSDGGGLAVEADGNLSGARSGMAAIDALLADTVDLRTVATIGIDGAVDVTEFRIASAGNAISGRIGFAGGRLSSDWSLTVPSVTDLSDLAGLAIDGRVTAGGRLQGPLERLSLESDISGDALVFEGKPIPDLTAHVRLDDLAGRPTGAIRLVGSVAERPAILEIGLEVREDGGVRFDPVASAFAGLVVSGAVDMLPDGNFDGRLAGRAEEVAPLAGLLDVPLSGQADIVADFSTSDGRQRLQTTLEMTGAAFDEQIAAATVSVEMAVDDLFGEPQLDGQATALDLRAGGVAFDRVALSTRGRAGALIVTLAVAGDQSAGEASGTLALSDDRTRLELDSLRAVIRGETFALASPAAIVISPAAISVERLVLRSGGGQAVLQGTLGETVDASLELVDVSLELIALVEPGVAVSGHVDGVARVQGLASRPEGSFELRSSDLRSGFAEGTGLPPAELNAVGRWSGGRLRLEIAASLADGARSAVVADMPLAIEPGGAALIVDARSKLVATATGTLDLSLFDDLLAAAGNSVEGLLTLDLQVSGTLSSPVVAGTTVLSNGRYENAFYGSRLEGISAIVTASGTALRLTELAATTPGGGTLAGSGSLALDPEKGFPVVLDVALRNGAVVDTALASATADADLRLSGMLSEKLLLSGEVSILGAEFRVPDRLPVAVPDLLVEEINLPPEIAASRAARRPSEPAAAVDAELDLVASARQAVFVRGRGLNVELDGDLTIKGSAAAPAIDGDLGLRSGTLDILGRRLTFSRGGLGFDGSSDIDPEIDLLAAADVDSVSVEVEVGGRVSAPTIALNSVPELPQDEIAARLLFGKGVQNLSAFEALTLAQSVGQLTGLTGSSAGLLDQMRQTIGLDRLEVNGGGETGQASVSGGRYLGQSVFVGVEQGLDEQSSRVNVEIELTPNIKVESDVGADAEGRVGVNLEWNY